MTVVDLKYGCGVEITCYKTHCCGMDLPYMAMIKCTVVVSNTYELYTLRENITFSHLRLLGKRVVSPP